MIDIREKVALVQEEKPCNDKHHSFGGMWKTNLRTTKHFGGNQMFEVGELLFLPLISSCEFKLSSPTTPQIVGPNTEDNVAHW